MSVTQAEAKQLVHRHQLASRQRGVSSLVNAINRNAGKDNAIAQRTLEKWLTEPDRSLQQEGWALVLSFMQSDGFRKLYSSDSPNGAGEE